MVRRAPSLVAALAVVLAVLGCASGPEAPPAPAVAPGTPPDPTPAAPPVPTVCTDDCLLLLEHDYDDLVDGSYCQVCGDSDPEVCSKGWPTEPLTCERVDYLRNCIYARLGYPFDTAPEWREVFDKEPWYTPRDGFRWSDVSPVQAANAKDLKAKSERRDCLR